MGGPCAWSEQGDTWVRAGDARSTWGRAEGRSVRCEAPRVGCGGPSKCGDASVRVRGQGAHQGGMGTQAQGAG